MSKGNKNLEGFLTRHLPVNCFFTCTVKGDLFSFLARIRIPTVLRGHQYNKVDDSDLYYFKDKYSNKITSKLEALGRTLLSGAMG